MDTAARPSHVPANCLPGPTLQHYAAQPVVTGPLNRDLVCKSIMDVLMADNVSSYVPFITAGDRAATDSRSRSNHRLPAETLLYMEGTDSAVKQISAGAAAVAGQMLLKPVSTDSLGDRQQQLAAAKVDASSNQHIKSTRVAVKQQDQLSKRCQEVTAAHAVRGHKPKRQKHPDLDTVYSLTLQRLAECIQQSERHQACDAVATAAAGQATNKQTACISQAAPSPSDSADADQSMKLVAPNDDTDEDAAAVGLIMMLHSRENSEQKRPNKPPAAGVGAFRSTARKTVAHSLQLHPQQGQKRPQCPCNSLQKAPVSYEDMQAGWMHQAASAHTAPGTEGVGGVPGGSAGVSSEVLLRQHKPEVLLRQAEAHTWQSAVQQAGRSTAAQAALSAAYVAAGTPAVAAQVLQQIQGVLQQQQQHELKECAVGAAAAAAAAKAPARKSAAAAAAESASYLSPADLLAAAAAPWYPYHGSRGGLMLKRDGKLAARKLYCLQTGATVTNATAAAGGSALDASICRKHAAWQAADAAVGNSTEPQQQQAKRPRFQQPLQQGDPALSITPDHEQAGVQLLLDAAASEGINTACDHTQQHSVRQLTDAQMLARMRERQEKQPVLSAGDARHQQGTAQDGTAASNRPSRARKAPAKLDDTLPTEGVLVGLNRSRPVALKPLHAQQQQWQLQGSYMLNRKRPDEQQQHGGVRLQLPQQRHQCNRPRLGILQQQLHNKPRQQDQQQQDKEVRGLPPGMSIIAGLKARQLNAALAAARATVTRTANAADAVINLPVPPQAGAKSSVGTFGKPAVGAPMRAPAVLCPVQAGVSSSTMSDSPGNVHMLSSNAQGNSSAGEQPAESRALAPDRHALGCGGGAAAASCPSAAADIAAANAGCAAVQKNVTGSVGSPVEANPKVSAAAGQGAKSADNAAGSTAAAAYSKAPMIRWQLKPGKTKLQVNKSVPMIRNRSQMEGILLEQQRIKVQEMLQRHKQRQQTHAAAATSETQQAAAGDVKQQQQQQSMYACGPPAQRHPAHKHAKRPWMSLAPQPGSIAATPALFAAAYQRSTSPDAPVYAACDAASAGRAFLVPAGSVVSAPCSNAAAATAAAAAAAGGAAVTSQTVAPSASTGAMAAAAAVVAVAPAGDVTVACRTQTAAPAAQSVGIASVTLEPAVRIAAAPAAFTTGSPECTAGVQAPKVNVAVAAAGAAGIACSAAAAAINPVGVCLETSTAALPTAADQSPAAAAAAPVLPMASAKHVYALQQQQQPVSDIAVAKTPSSTAATELKAAATTASSLRAKLLASLSADDDTDNNQAAAGAGQAAARLYQPTAQIVAKPSTQVAATPKQHKGVAAIGSQPTGNVGGSAAQKHSRAAASPASAALRVQTSAPPTAMVLQRVSGTGLVGVPLYVPGMTSQQVVTHVQQQQRHLLLASIQEQQRKQLMHGTAVFQQKVAALAVGVAAGARGSHQVPAGQ